ncbi:hypothetical protein CROQUDRAFT_101390 [Cronartium quercuum f. sp. fusiforme G11]|uniref:Uncharacterized protein n=1 Tax=Cronartium quercuum f. sp. fusiforme G11 TaxID=708437 RepID=A0A9P6T567_9BASI|nr:hypothetical protein CROQUDRAFT_101390 [Cronartium quercuum f. sp. fusiforme G11]
MAMALPDTSGSQSGNEEINPTEFQGEFKYNLFYNTSTKSKPKWKSANLASNPCFTIQPLKMTLADLRDQCATIVSAYLASRNLEMNTKEQYQEWASKALLFGPNNQKPACAWKMAKPDDPAVIAAQDFEDVEDTTEINQCIARISRKGVMDVRYNCHTKVYLIPDDLI